MKRRDLLGLGGLTLVGVTLLPASARAEIPKRGGTITLRLWDPPHFDPYLQVSYKTHIVYSFTHSRLVKHKVGPAVVPGTFAIEGDLAESWSQPDETTYVFKLRRGVRWQPKGPVNGRELIAEDVVYSVERFRTIKGNANASMLKPLDRVEAIDRHTVRFTMKEPYAWFLDVLANPMAVCIVARECVEKFGDLRSPEATVGTGPWMLDSYRPNVGMTLVRNPGYFVAGLPYIDRVEIFVDEDNASRMAAFLGGKYDIGWENPGTINRSDWADQGHPEAAPSESTDGRVSRQRRDRPLHAHRQGPVQRRPRAPGDVHGHRPARHRERDARRGRRHEPLGAGGDQGVVHPPRSAGRGRAIPPIRSGRGEEAPR